jgi:hypothetical protein
MCKDACCAERKVITRNLTPIIHDMSSSRQWLTVRVLEDVALSKNLGSGLADSMVTAGSDYRIADFRVSCILLVNDAGHELGWLQPTQKSADKTGNWLANMRSCWPVDIFYPDGSFVFLRDQIDVLCTFVMERHEAQLRAAEAPNRTAFYKESGLLMEDLEQMTLMELRNLWRRFGLSWKHLDTRDKYRADALDMLQRTIGSLTIYEVGDHRVGLKCTNLAGVQLAQLDVCCEAGITGEELLMKVAEQSGVPPERLELVLPNCEVLDKESMLMSTQIEIKM